MYCIVSHPFHGQCQIIILLRILWHHHHILRIIFTLSLLTQTCKENVDSGQALFCTFCCSTEEITTKVSSHSLGAQCVTSSLPGCHQLTDTALSPGQCPSSTRPCPRSPSTRPLIGQQATSRPLIGHTGGAVPRHEHTRHNQVLSPPVTKDTLAQNFPKKFQSQSFRI